MESSDSSLTDTVLITRDAIIEKIKSFVTSNDSVMDLSYLYKAIIKNDESLDIIKELITYFWTADYENTSQIIFTIINCCASLDVTSCKSLLNHVKALLHSDKLLQANMIKIIPVLVNNINLYDSNYVAFCEWHKLDCHLSNLSILSQSLRDISSLSSVERSLFIRRLIEYLYIVDMEQCPLIVDEILRTCDKSSIQYCVGATVNFFNDQSISNSQLSQNSISEDNRRLLKIQNSVLNYYYKIGQKNVDFTKELIKFCKASSSVYCISGFMCVILLKLASLNYIKDQIFDLLKSSIIHCINDNKLFMESAFARECNCEHCDLTYLLTHSVKFCCASGKTDIAPNLIELAFLLIKSGLPQSKTVNISKSGSTSSRKETRYLISDHNNNDFNMSSHQKIGKAGIQMIMHLFGKLNSFRKSILDQILQFILKESHKSAVYVYIELLADLISLYPHETLESIDPSTGQPIFEMLLSFTQPVAISLVHALLPLIRYSINIRDNILQIIVTNMLSGRQHSRLICVESALILLKYFRITTIVNHYNTEDQNSSVSSDPVSMSILTQCSQFASTQIAVNSKPLAVDNSINDEICAQLLVLLNEATNQYHDVKAIVYQGLIQAIQHNVLFSRNVLKFLLDKLTNCLSLDEGVVQPFLIDKIVNQSTIIEPISTLVSCLWQCLYSIKSKNSSSNDELIKEVESVLNKILNSLTILSNDEFSGDFLLLSDNILELYDVFFTFTISQSSPNEQMLEKLFDKKESIKKVKTDNKNTKIKLNNEFGNNNNLMILTQCFSYLTCHLTKEIQEKQLDHSNYNITTQRRNATNTNNHSSARILELSLNNLEQTIETSGSTLFIYEKIVIYIAYKLLNCLRKMGTSQMRITSRNRIEYCEILTQIVDKSLQYYIECLLSNETVNMSSNQRQIIRLSLEIYTVSLDKVTQHLSKVLQLFMEKLTTDLDGHLTLLQNKLTNSTEYVAASGTCTSMKMFLKINRSCVKNLLKINNKKLYSDIELLLSNTFNLAIFCGLEDANLLLKNGSKPYVFGLGQLNTSSLSSLSAWLYQLLKSSKVSLTQNRQHSVDINDGSVCRTVVNVYLNSCRFVMPDWVTCIEKIIIDNCRKIGYFDDTNVQEVNDSKSFAFINDSTELITVFISVISLALDETDWIINKWRSGWTNIRQKKSITNSQLSNLDSTPREVIETSLNFVTEQERNLNLQLILLSRIMKQLMKCNIINIYRLEDILKLATRLFVQLGAMGKQYLNLTKLKLGSFSTVFEKLVRTTGDLSTQVSSFIVQMQKMEVMHDENYESKCDSGSKDDISPGGTCSKKKIKPSKEQTSRTKKEMRLIPNIIFTIEQYQAVLIDLQKCSNIDLMSNMKPMCSRDFYISNKRVHESLKNMKTLDQSTLSDIDDVIEPAVEDNHNQSETLSPPRKLMRI